MGSEYTRDGLGGGTSAREFEDDPDFKIVLDPDAA